jgi:lipopolysaccharide transport system ATP-binding protein
MNSFKNSGVTIVFVSHSMENVDMICERAIWIENHRTMMVGKAEYVTEKFAESF